MTLQLHNTLTRKTEEFIPLHDHRVSLYTCGPTVYNYLTVGNWTAYIYWDILVRTLIANGYDVTRVMNITDVGHLTSDADEGEDKLEKGAKREGKTAWDVAKFYTADFIDGMKHLGMIMPTHTPHATAYIPQQLELIRTLKQKGYTYQIDDGIYFDTSKFPSYADFAGLDLEAQKAGARVEYNVEKRNPSDFALWKFTPLDEKRDMEWETPIDILESNAKEPSDHLSSAGMSPQGRAERHGLTEQSPVEWPEGGDGERTANKTKGDKIMGFPGWHLECSAMAMDLLGDTIDIHTGGIDHIPVHHTNEIAQSEAASDQQFSHFWLHCNHLKVNGTKISKSLGNGYTLQDLEARGFSPMDFRMFALQGQYSNEGNFTFENLEAARHRRLHWRAVAALRWQVPGKSEERRFDRAEASILAALNDNLNTPEALRTIDETFDELENAEDVSAHDLTLLLKFIDDVLGLQLLDSTPDIDQETKQLIADRNQARAAKDWSAADALRQQLLQKGVALRDTTSGSLWEYTKK